ncbi:hypothetical protein ACIA8O_31220 [Kitasatospora sp. NPDC051853]|uniref:hypothetical protein n=1 Tax=Kitasatospora sp. NPDC051853 TaxID=3364058 RepID=UPI0037AE6612
MPTTDAHDSPEHDSPWLRVLHSRAVDVLLFDNRGLKTGGGLVVASVVLGPLVGRPALVGMLLGLSVLGLSLALGLLRTRSVYGTR